MGKVKEAQQISPSHPFPASSRPGLIPGTTLLRARPAVPAAPCRLDRDGAIVHDGFGGWVRGSTRPQAKAVTACLMAQGIAAEMIPAEGRGENGPIAGNATRKGRQKNRRLASRVIAEH